MYIDSDNFDLAFDKLCDLINENEGCDKVELFQRVISEVRLTEREKAELFRLVLQKD